MRSLIQAVMHNQRIRVTMGNLATPFLSTDLREEAHELEGWGEQCQGSDNENIDYLLL